MGFDLTEELLAGWTLLDADRDLLGKRVGTAALGFVLTLKLFEHGARFARSVEEFSTPQIFYVASQLGASVEDLGDYDFSGRTAKRHRAEIRAAFDFREFVLADEQALVVWLAENVCPWETRESVLIEALLARCRGMRIEPPSRISRIIGAAKATFESQFCSAVVGVVAELVKNRTLVR